MDGVVHAHENGVAHESENNRVGVQRTDAPERSVRNAEVEFGEHQLEGRRDTHQHADNPENHAGDAKVADNLVVVLEVLDLHLNESFDCCLVVGFQKRFEHFLPKTL